MQLLEPSAGSKTFLKFLECLRALRPEILHAVLGLAFVFRDLLVSTGTLWCWNPLGFWDPVEVLELAKFWNPMQLLEPYWFRNLS